MSGILLRCLAGKDSFKVPLDKVTIGRGPFLKVTDKRVSRNHATLEIGKSGKLILTPIHTNPCFYKAGGRGQRETLPKDKTHVLNHGDVIGLLPDTLFYEVIYVDNQQTPSKRRAGRPPGRTKSVQKEPEDSLSDDASFPNGETESHDTTAFKKKIAKVGNKPMAVPLDMKRKLPRWMVGAAKRVNLGDSTQAVEISPHKPKIAANVRQPRQNNVEQAELRTPKIGRGRPRKTVEEDDDEEELSQPTRRPRAASAKKPTYKDEFLMVSGSESDFSNFSSDEEVLPRKKNRKLDDDDLDFVMEREDESDSDWEVTGKSASKPKGRGRGRGRPRRPSPVKRQKRKRRYSDDYFSDDDFDSYVPRPSKRRAASARKTRMSDDEEDDESPPSRKRRGAPAPRKNRDRERKASPVDKTSDTSEDDEEEEKPNRKLKKIDDKAASPQKAKTDSSKADDEDEENDDDVQDSVPGKRRSCWFGKRCYRKNPQHRAEFCHPGDSSYEEDNDDDPRIPRKAHRGRKAPLREKDKKSILHGASDDEGEPNTYDYDDSFLDDAPQGSSTYMDPGDEDDDWEPEEAESEGDDIRSLVTEAKGFLKNKKMQKPVQTK